MTQMMICPNTDIKTILNAMKKAKLIIETVDPNDYIGKSFPLELGYAALYKYFVSSGEIKIAGSEIRDIIERKLHAQEKENRSSSPVRVVITIDDDDETATKKKVVMGPPPPAKKGILKVTAKRGIKPKEEIFDERPIHHIPILDFESVEEDSEENSSSSSTSSLSVSRGQPTVQKGKAQKSQKTATSTGVTKRGPRRGTTNPK